ncbi:MAG: DUF853 family protein [Ruminococcaceae bacterium]|nr:DUF853 family protein [Oscillospiraceae bacterium]
MYADERLWIAHNKDAGRLYLRPEKANRHGLIAGATGTGKTISLKVMAESFSDLGVPVFLADIKGDLAGMIAPGVDSENMRERINRFGIDNWEYRRYPTMFWDVFGEKGHNVRTTISEMGPLLLARQLGLNETQTGILNIVFRFADENGLLLLDIKDLKAVLRNIAENSKLLSAEYGNIAPQSVNTILRAILPLEDQGGEIFFGEPSFDVKDFMKTTYDGRGWINVLHCEKLFTKPLLYSTFLMWLLTELYEALPEVGDAEKPKVVFFFDEAHLLFDDAPKILIQKIEQVVRLIRSKGVGVYFISQSPTDIPDSILAQLGNRVQHALRAFTPAEIKKVRAAADTFRANPNFSTMDTIMELATGEALVSFLTEDGSPMPVERAFILPPQSKMGGISDDERAAAMQNDGIGSKYDTAVDRESAYELLTAKAEQAAVEAEQEAEVLAEERNAALEKKAEAQMKAASDKTKKAALTKAERIAKSAANSATRSVISSTLRRSVTKNQSIGTKAMNSAYNSVLNGVGREISTSIVRGLFGNLLGK